MQQLYFLWILFLFSRTAPAQDIEFWPESDLHFYFNEDSLGNTVNKGFKIRFCSVDNGKYFTINKLGYKNISAKTMAFIRDYQVYVVSDGKGIKFFTFAEAFPKGGFYKTGKTKLIFGEKAEAYTLDNDVLEMTLWATDGLQEPNALLDNFRNMGLLGNLPKNKKILAYTIKGLEFEPNQIKATSSDHYKNSYYLETFLMRHRNEKQKPCDSSYPITDDTWSITTTDMYYQTTQEARLKDANGKKDLFNNSRTVYLNTDGSEYLTISNEKGEKAFYTNETQKIYCTGIVHKDTFYYDKAFRYTPDTCTKKETEKLLLKEGSMYTYLYCNKENFRIKKTTINTSYKELKNARYANGLLTNIEELTDSLDEFRLTVHNITQGSYRFYFKRQEK